MSETTLGKGMLFIGGKPVGVFDRVEYSKEPIPPAHELKSFERLETTISVSGSCRWYTAYRSRWYERPFLALHDFGHWFARKLREFASR